MRSVKYWNRLSRDVVEPLPLDVIKSRLDTALSILLSLSLLLARGLNWAISRRAFLPQPFCASVKTISLVAVLRLHCDHSTMEY